MDKITYYLCFAFFFLLSYSRTNLYLLSALNFVNTAIMKTTIIFFEFLQCLARAAHTILSSFIKPKQISAYRIAY